MSLDSDEECEVTVVEISPSNMLGGRNEFDDDDQTTTTLTVTSNYDNHQQIHLLPNACELVTGQQSTTAPPPTPSHHLHPPQPASRSLNIWHAARRGDMTYIHEYVVQELERREALEVQQTRSTQITSQMSINKKKGGAGSTIHASSTPIKSVPGSTSDKSYHRMEDDSGLNTFSQHHGLTPLHVSCIFQHRPVVELLLKSGASVHTPDLESGWSVLHHVLYRGDFLTAHLLLRCVTSTAAKSLISQLDYDQATAFDLVANHIGQSNRRREENGSGRTTGSNTDQRFVRMNALTADTSSAFRALTHDTSTRKELDTHNLLFSFGFQTNYTLGFSCEHYQHRARLIDTFASTSVRQVVALRQAVFVLLCDGTVYSHGAGASGKLGHETKETLIQPKRIASLSSITHIAGTDEFLLAANEKGHVFIFGYSVFITDSAPAPSTSSKPASNSRLQSGSHSPPPSSRTLDANNSTAAASSSVKSYSQLPRRLESLRSLQVAQLFPSANRILILTQSDELWFIGQSIEDVDRWESAPKRFAAPITDPILQICNRDEFVAILTTAGVIRIQRQGERKLNKLWLQNYPEISSRTTMANEGDKKKSLRDLFPLIPPKQHIVKMSWTTDGQRFAAVTREGQLFLGKLPQPETKLKPNPLFTANTSTSALFATSSSSPPIGSPMDQVRTTTYPRCIGYLVEGLAHVRVTDVSIASGHTTALTEDGHVYSFGPSAIGHIHPTDSTNNQTTTSSSSAILRPKRLRHLSQVSNIFASDQYLLVMVSIIQPPVLPAFPELHGLYETDRKLKLTSIEVPSLRILCQHHLAEQITPLSVVAAYQWAFDTHSSHLLQYCTTYLLQNLPFYLPTLLALPDVACLTYLQQQYAIQYPMWWYSPQWTQPLQPDQLATTESHSAPHSFSSSSVGQMVTEDSETFSFSHALAQLKAAAIKAAQPKTVEERVNEIKLKRRALSKKLVQIDALERMNTKLDSDQKEKVAWKGKYQQEVTKLDQELVQLRDNGSISASTLYDQLFPTESTKPPKASTRQVPTPTPTAPIESSSRVASELLRPTRPLTVKSTENESTPTETITSKSKQNKKQQIALSNSTSTPQLLSQPPSNTSSWKAPTSTSGVAGSTISSTTPASSTPLKSSFADIQAEEAKLAAEMARAQLSNTKLTHAANKTASQPTIIPAGSKGWSVKPITSPVLASSVAPKQQDFPTLVSANNLPTVKSTAPSRSLSSTYSRDTPPAGSSGGFSLADFMPKYQMKPVPIKGWNMSGATAAVDSSITVATNQTANPSVSSHPSKGGHTKSEEKENKNTKSKKSAPICISTAAPAIQPQPGSMSPTLAPSSPPISLRLIQEAEVLRCYGPTASFKTQRQLDLEFELSAAASYNQRPAWNSMNLSHTNSSPPPLASVQTEELAAALAAEELARRKKEAKEKKKLKKAAAKARDAMASQTEVNQTQPSTDGMEVTESKSVSVKKVTKSSTAPSSSSATNAASTATIATSTQRPPHPSQPKKSRSHPSNTKDSHGSMASTSSVAGDNQDKRQDKPKPKQPAAKSKPKQQPQIKILTQPTPLPAPTP